MIKPIFDWGMHNWCLLPTVYVGRGLRDRSNWWLYATWLRGRIGFARR
jgi:hypothetical protein